MTPTVGCQVAWRVGRGEGGSCRKPQGGGGGVPCTLEDCVHACRWRQTVYHTWLPILYRFHNDNTVTAACSESKVMYKPTCLFRPSDATSFRVRTNVFGIQLSRCVARPPCALCALYAICSAGGWTSPAGTCGARQRPSGFGLTASWHLQAGSQGRMIIVAAWLFRIPSGTGAVELAALAIAHATPTD